MEGKCQAKFSRPSPAAGAHHRPYVSSLPHGGGKLVFLALSLRSWRLRGESAVPHSPPRRKERKESANMNAIQCRDAGLNYICLLTAPRTKTLRTSDKNPIRILDVVRTQTAGREDHGCDRARSGALPAGAEGKIQRQLVLLDRRTVGRELDRGSYRKRLVFYRRPWHHPAHRRHRRQDGAGGERHCRCLRLAGGGPFRPARLH